MISANEHDWYSINSKSIMFPVCSGRLCSSEIIPSPVCDHTPAAQQPAVSSPAPSVTPAPAELRAHGRQHQQRVRDGAQHPAAEETPPQPHHLHRAAAAGPGEEVPETEISLHSRQVSDRCGRLLHLIWPFLRPVFMPHKWPKLSENWKFFIY